jgi:hypothetical protein
MALELWELGEGERARKGEKARRVTARRTGCVVKDGDERIFYAKPLAFSVN